MENHSPTKQTRKQTQYSRIENKIKEEDAVFQVPSLTSCDSANHHPITSEQALRWYQQDAKEETWTAPSRLADRSATIQVCADIKLYVSNSTDVQCQAGSSKNNEAERGV
jgi:hypothetical protein